MFVSPLSPNPYLILDTQYPILLPMLAKEFRFHRQNDVRRVYSKGKSVRSGPLGLKYLKNTTTKSNRVAVVVSKKIDKRAVVRNRIRRRVYEIIRKHWSEMEQGYDLVITIFNVSVAIESQGELEHRVSKLLISADLKK